MTQDTRKDRRVKIVSLNVRYKSATVDEFIENHAHDVSRGGIYIKTGNPFPSGTLLKFEIRLASDQAVITGVGRVVWKRDSGVAVGDRPAGMGVKFIKIDDPSKLVIDRLVTSRADAGKAYESEAETPGVPIGAPQASPQASATSAAAPRAAGPGAFGRKATMIGIGNSAAAPSAPPRLRTPVPSAPPRPGIASPDMFPKGTPETGEPKQEQTVMKQAAELLEEALREAGGSMDEVGTNPLFSGTGHGAEPSGAPATPRKSGAPEAGPAHSPTGVSDGLSNASSTEPSSARGEDAAKARAMSAGLSPAPPRKASSDPPRTSRESPVAKSARPPGAVAKATDPPAASKKGGSGGLLVVVVLVAAAVAAVTFFRDQLFGSGTAATPAAPSSAPATTVSAAAETAAAETAAPSASALPSASASAAPAPSAAASTAPTVTAMATAPAPAVKPLATAVSAPTPPKPVMAATPSPMATSAATAAATAAAPAKPRPKPKPADDNPY